MRSVRAGARRSLAGIVLLVALLLQSVLVQTHRHHDRLPIAAGPVHIAASGHDAGDAACPLCAEIARAGHYLGAAPAPLPVPPATFVVVLSAGGLRASATVRRMYDWLSRAPPEGPTPQR